MTIENKKHYVSRKLRVYLAEDQFNADTQMNYTLYNPLNSYVMLYTETGKYYEQNDSYRDALAKIANNDRSKLYVLGENFQAINIDQNNGYIYKTAKNFVRASVSFSSKDSSVNIEYLDRKRTYPILSNNKVLQIANKFFDLKERLNNAK